MPVDKESILDAAGRSRGIKPVEQGGRAPKDGSNRKVSQCEPMWLRRYLRHDIRQLQVQPGDSHESLPIWVHDCFACSGFADDRLFGVLRGPATTGGHGGRIRRHVTHRRKRRNRRCERLRHGGLIGPRWRGRLVGRSRLIGWRSRLIGWRSRLIGPRWRSRHLGPRWRSRHLGPGWRSRHLGPGWDRRHEWNRWSRTHPVSVRLRRL
jgi:hypothetical protein